MHTYLSITKMDKSLSEILTLQIGSMKVIRNMSFIGFRRAHIYMLDTFN